MKKIVYVTGNQLKVDYLKSIINSNQFEVVAKKMDCPEIQSDSILEVAAFSAKWACNELKTDVLKNDSGLVIPALNGFPSAYSKYVEQTLGAEGILKLMEGKENREAYYLDAFAYCEVGKEPKVFVSKSHGYIATEKSGSFGNEYDTIFVPQGKTKTMANMTYEEFLTCFNDDAANALFAYLKQNK